MVNFYLDHTTGFRHFDPSAARRDSIGFGVLCAALRSLLAAWQVDYLPA
jgi:hypothetical protein